MERTTRCCCVPLCGSRSAPSFIACHPLPLEPRVRQAWIEFVRSCPSGGEREWAPLQSGEEAAFVCHRHFALGCFDFRREDGRPRVLRAYLKADAVPSVYLDEEGRLVAAADKAGAQGSSVRVQASSVVQGSQEHSCPSTSSQGKTCLGKKHLVPSVMEQLVAAKVARMEPGTQSEVKAATKSLSSTVHAAPSSVEDSMLNSSRTVNVPEVSLCPNPELTKKEVSQGRKRTRSKRQASSAMRQHVMAKVARLRAGMQDKVEAAAKSTSCSIRAGPTSLEGCVENTSKSTQATGTLDASEVALNAEMEEPADEKALEWCPAGPSSCDRVRWPDAVTSNLISIWEDYFPKLNSNTEDTSLYEEMVAKLNAGLSPGDALYTAKQVLAKINRLKKNYWKEKHMGCARVSSGQKWSIRLHSFLGSLPASDDDQLMDQNVEIKVAAEEQEEVQAPPLLDQGADKAKRLGSRESESDMDDFLSSTSDSQESSGVTTRESNGSNEDGVSNAAVKRSIRRGVSNSFLWQLVAIQKESARRAAEDDRRHLEMRNKMLKLQEESTRMNTKMMEILNNYFTSESNKE
ncbi:uncharacterized protein [Dermacentor andersoni]|uniref:uncharacterized protein isoform X2 n=1 Tax=Dermacentor andersoni TaxID=34620 RepID=UPI00215560EF|nr:uncharacterized protein LOC126526617 isoform X2 [Dermacentor andersoni]